MSHACTWKPRRNIASATQMNAPSAETDEFGISRPPILPNALPPKPFHDDQAPGLIEIDTTRLHQTLQLALTAVIEAGARVAGFDVGAQVEGAAVQSGSGIVGEGGREAGVAERGGEGRQAGEPVLAGEVDDFVRISLTCCERGSHPGTRLRTGCAEEQEDREAVEDVRHGDL